METLVRLDGETIDIEGLITVVPTSDWQIRKESDGFYLTSPMLNDIANNREVVAKAQEILDLLNGAANLVFENHTSVTPGSIVRLDAGGKRHYVILTDSITIKMRLVVSSSSKDGTDENFSAWLETSKKNETVRDVLFFFSELTWFNLYKVYEIICKDVGSEKKLLAYMTRTELISFRQTAQSRDAIGKLARHGKKIPPPKKIMAFDEACHLWRRIFRDWVRQKIDDCA